MDTNDEDDQYLELPGLIELSQYGGNFDRYLEAVYEIFVEEFVRRKPKFRGFRLALKKYPVTDGKEATFWHITSEGEDEEHRTPDLRRLERIKCPSFIINNSEHPYLRVWENSRGTKTNVLIMHEDESYVVILRKGNGYLLPWTAYVIEHNWRRKKFIKEYEEYIKSKERQ